jgi:hypothetical protein
MCCEHESEMSGPHSRRHGRPGRHCCTGTACGCSCCCCGCRCGCQDSPYGMRRRFTSRAEQIKELERYLGQLEEEATGVRERITDLKAGGTCQAP